tara:strand:- start:33 stop:914 length:882 start_codon:yes stop_codon:yes gene_type:complete
MTEESSPSEPEAPATPSEAQPSEPESFNIFSEEPSPIQAEEPSQPSEPGPPPKSKEFLANLRRDKELRSKEIQMKQREQQLSQREQQLGQLREARQKLEESPEEFLRSQGIDPAEYYQKWTQRQIYGDQVPVEQQVNKTQKELEDLKAELARRDAAARQQVEDSRSKAAFGTLITEVEDFATGTDQYQLVKDACSAQDVVQGMVAYYRKTGENITIEEAFSKIEDGLRNREEEFYSSEAAAEKFRRYNPGAVTGNRGRSATMSSAWQQQPTRKDAEDLSYEEIREMYKGKLFT